MNHRDSAIRMLKLMLALIYDVHGNLAALEAVLEDAAAEGATEYLLGGDYCLIGSRPAAVLERLRALPPESFWLRGNTERWVADPAAEDIPADPLRDACRFVSEAIGEIDVAELLSLPQRLEKLPVAGADGIVFCHASPSSDMIGFTDKPAETDGDAADSGAEANTIVCGHTHIQFRREVGVVEIVNPGSVGLPFDGDQRAAYALLNDDGAIGFRRVEYDVEAAIDAYGELEGDWTQIAIRRLREARP